jgi:dsDNA-specific endonuclease/ATPase MutS2
MQIADDITLRSLEWEKIKNLLLTHCLTPMGKERVERISPSTDIETVRKSLRETGEAIELLRFAPPLKETTDVEPLIQRVEKGGFLQENELIEIREFLLLAQRIKSFLLERRDSSPHLSSLARRIQDFTQLIATITSAISDDGKIRDNASERMRVVKESI